MARSGDCASQSAGFVAQTGGKRESAGFVRNVRTGLCTGKRTQVAGRGNFTSGSVKFVAQNFRRAGPAHVVHHAPLGFDVGATGKMGRCRGRAPRRLGFVANKSGAEDPQALYALRNLAETLEGEGKL